MPQLVSHSVKCFTSKKSRAKLKLLVDKFSFTKIVMNKVEYTCKRAMWLITIDFEGFLEFSGLLSLP